MNDSSSLEQKEPVQKAPFRVLIAEQVSSDSANLIEQAAVNVNNSKSAVLIESVRVKDPQNSLDVLQKAEEEGNPFHFFVVPGTKNAEFVGPRLLAAIRKKGIHTPRTLVLSTTPGIENHIDPNDMKTGRVMIVNRYDVIQKGAMEELLEREGQESLKTNNA